MSNRETAAAWGARMKAKFPTPKSTVRVGHVASPAIRAALARVEELGTAYAEAQLEVHAYHGIVEAPALRGRYRR